MTIRVRNHPGFPPIVLAVALTVLIVQLLLSVLAVPQFTVGSRFGFLHAGGRAGDWRGCPIDALSVFLPFPTGCCGYSPIWIGRIIPADSFPPTPPDSFSPQSRGPPC